MGRAELRGVQNAGHQGKGSVVLVGQSSGHPNHQLLPGSLRLSCEFLAKVRRKNNHQHVTQELWKETQKDIQKWGKEIKKRIYRTNSICKLFSLRTPQQSVHSNEDAGSISLLKGPPWPHSVLLYLFLLFLSLPLLSLAPFLIQQWPGFYKYGITIYLLEFPIMKEADTTYDITH